MLLSICSFFCKTFFKRRSVIEKIENNAVAAVCGNRISALKAIVTRVWAGPKVVSNESLLEVDIAGAYFQNSQCPFLGLKTLKKGAGGVKN